MQVCDVERNFGFVCSNICSSLVLQIVHLILDLDEMLPLLRVKLHASTLEIIYDFIDIPFALKIK